MTELRKLEVDPTLLTFIAVFLTDRQQAVRIGATLSDWNSSREVCLKELN